ATRAHPDLHSFPTRRSSDLPQFRMSLPAAGNALAQKTVPVGATIEPRLVLKVCGTVGRSNSLKSPTLILAVGTLTNPKSFVVDRSEEHTSELQSQSNLVCRL